MGEDFVFPETRLEETCAALPPRYACNMSAPSMRLFLWPDRLLFLGPGFETEGHRHHAAQICVGLDEPLRLRASSRSGWQRGVAFFIAPDQPHELDAGTGATAVVYLEAEGVEYARLLKSAPFEPLRKLHPVPELGSIRRLLQDGGDARAADAAARSLLDLREPFEAADTNLDLRIAAALVWITDHIAEPIRIARVAQAVHLSESHLAHLFSAQIGVPLRRYVLWRRLGVAVEKAIQGAMLTESAQAAGFADSAHLSRTFKATFGVTPSFLFRTRDRVEVTLCASRAGRPAGCRVGP